MISNSEKSATVVNFAKSRVASFAKASSRESLNVGNASEQLTKYFFSYVEPKYVVGLLTLDLFWHE